MFSEGDSFRFYIKIEDIIIFKSLMFDNNIPIKNEIEPFTKTKSQTFYCKKSDLNNVDTICKKNNIDILDYITPYYNDRFSIQKHTKSLYYLSIIIIIIFITFFIF